MTNCVKIVFIKLSVQSIVKKLAFTICKNQYCHTKLLLVRIHLDLMTYTYMFYTFTKVTSSPYQKLVLSKKRSNVSCLFKNHICLSFSFANFWNQTKFRIEENKRKLSSIVIIEENAHVMFMFALTFSLSPIKVCQLDFSPFGKKVTSKDQRPNP